MSAEAIKTLEAEIESTEAAQAPIREQIAELEAQLHSGDATVARNRAAIDLLNGDAPIPNGRTARKAAPRRPITTGTADVVSRDRIVDYLGANGKSKAGDIAAGIGHTGGQTLTKVLGEMVEEGVIIKEGVKRGTTYVLKAG